MQSIDFKTIDSNSKILTKDTFIDREKELAFLEEWVKKHPNRILFIYGPKSSGKTTLLMKFIEKISKGGSFHIKTMNLREILIHSYKDFIKTFFEIDFERSKDEIKEKREYNLKVFKLTTEILKGLENKEYDPFVVMKTELQKITKKGIRPIIFIDELQALEDIYINGQRPLLKELFNFFVAMTKESHLCHVIIASSDGYFMNRIYNDSKLLKTSDFYEVEYLTEENTRYWLNNLKKESLIDDFILTESQIETIYKYFGGSMWEISNILDLLAAFAENKKVKDEDLMDIINKKITYYQGKYNHFATLKKHKRALLKEIYRIQQNRDTLVSFGIVDLEILVNNSFYEIDELIDELNELVRRNYLAYNPTDDSFKLQGKSMYYGLKSFVEKILT